ncbi:MAG: DUF4082 domain-containing protein [Calothrix sp. C42_A2020_038]|nr:DUF4082 domain-containing protein [Calothrix sp. C42_A2020_038]
MANQTVFTTQTPSNSNASDGTAYELGMKFQSSQAGQITVIRYWKSPSETGSHVGKIWAGTGGTTPLATVTFTNETASGWQEQALTTPLNIQANTVYVVSVNCNSHFPITYDALATVVTNGNLSSVADNNNGVFGNVGSFPSNSYRNSNYFRDIGFVVTSIPTITKTGGDNQTGTVGAALSNPLVVKIENGGNPQAGVTVNFTVTAGGGSVSPASAVTDANGQASTILTLGAAPGAVIPITNTVNASVPSIGIVTFNATANPAGVTVANVFTNQTPVDSNVSDNVTYELGMKFRSTKAGQITGIRFWKAASETGSHIGKIWSADGTLLGSVIFADETASGWQVQALDTPVNIDPNIIYVVSVNVNSFFAITYDVLAGAITNGVISSIGDGNNGVYGNINAFPTNSYRNSNYFRDVILLIGSTINKVSGDNQSGAVGTVLPNPLVVRVEDGNNNPQSGVTVTFTVTEGGGTVSNASIVTDSNGQASTTLMLGNIPSGPNSAVIVTATAPGIGSTAFSAKAAPANANTIYLENIKTGTTNWVISNYALDEITGYAAVTSVNKGGSLPIKVSLKQAGSFQVEVYRLGYYGGSGGRLVLSSGSINGIVQPACTLNSTTNLVECNWSDSYTIAVGSDWTSGLYIAKLIHQASGKQSAIWFVVRDDSSNADILFQSSFTTFQAYNNQGKYSLYAWNSQEGQKAVKVSFDRPFTQTTSAGVWYFDSMMRFERHMVRWLESQSYNVSYITNLDVQANPQIIRQHKVFLSVGHDEYWSMQERDALEQARDANPPVNLAFFSANTAYWHIRFENSTSGQANRIMTCYKSNDDSISPPTNKFRLINRPENALLGVMYTGDKSDGLYDTTTNINSPSYSGFDFVVANSNNPYYANTGLTNGAKLTGLVGFEWDAVVNNGATPSNLVVLSQSSVVPGNIDPDVPPGTNYNVSNAVRYTASSGGKVFSTGSVHWMFGLDNGGNSTNLTDRRAKQIAVNVFADMGAKPQTPDANIIVP